MHLTLLLGCFLFLHAFASPQANFDPDGPENVAPVQVPLRFSDFIDVLDGFQPTVCVLLLALIYGVRRYRRSRPAKYSLSFHLMPWFLRILDGDGGVLHRCSILHYSLPEVARDFARNWWSRSRISHRNADSGACNLQ
jgi:hypothetical protein